MTLEHSLFKGKTPAISINLSSFNNAEVEQNVCSIYNAEVERVAFHLWRNIQPIQTRDMDSGSTDERNGACPPPYAAEYMHFPTDNLEHGSKEAVEGELPGGNPPEDAIKYEQPHPQPVLTPDKENDDDLCEQLNLDEPLSKDPIVIAQVDMIASMKPESALEIALTETLKRKQAHIERITNEIFKLRKFVKKRKQTYKRKRKNDGAPTRALSAYNLFIRERFAQLAKENEKALKSDDAGAALRRVPPAKLVRKTGFEWKTLPAEEKAKYEERAKSDKKRYDEQMAEYKPPNQETTRKRNKTGYNMFFSAHVLRMKQSDSGVPSERGSVARLVGTAWKMLPQEEKVQYEREADKHNGMHPIKDGEEEPEPEDETTHQQVEYHHAYPPEMHHLAPPPMNMLHHHGYYQPAPHVYGPPYGYDYSQHQRHQQARAQGYQQAYHPPPHHHGYDRP